jgi:hypothetical protein
MIEVICSSETSVLTHNITFQKTAFFIVTAMKTSNLPLLGLHPIALTAADKLHD